MSIKSWDRDWETHPGIELHVHLSDTTLNEIEKFQRLVKRKHRKNKGFLVKHGKQKSFIIGNV